MKKQKIEEVDIAQLILHPKCEGIYRKFDNTELADEIKKNGILHLPNVDVEGKVLDGVRTIQAAISAGYTKIKVNVVDVSDEDAPAYRVLCNTMRVKSDGEIFQELKILREFYGTKQGKRPVIHEKESGLENLDLRSRMAKITGLSQTKIQRIEKLGQLNLLSYSDTNVIPLTALYNSAEQKNNGVSNYKPVEEISLNVVCCNQCRQPTGKLVFTRAGEINYKDQTGADQILF